MTIAISLRDKHALVNGKIKRLHFGNSKSRNSSKKLSAVDVLHFKKPCSPFAYSCTLAALCQLVVGVYTSGQLLCRVFYLTIHSW